MSALNRPAVKRVREILKTYNSEAIIIELEETARTANDAAKNIGTELGSIVKSLVFTISSQPVMVLISGDKFCDTKILNNVFGISGKVQRLNAESVRSVTGFSIGGVAPLGHLVEIPVAIDSALQRFNPIYAAAGHPHCVFSTTFEELKIITGGLISEEVSVISV